MGIGFLINWIFTIWAALTFFIWTKIKGINLFGAKQFVRSIRSKRTISWGVRGMSFSASFTIDIIPGTDAGSILSVVFMLFAFTWTLTVVIIVITTRLDDKFNTGLFSGGLSKF